MVEQKSNQQLDGQMLKHIIIKFAEAWKTKIKTQGGVGTFHDNEIRSALTICLENIDLMPWDGELEEIIKLWERLASRENVETFISYVVNWYYGRFVDYDTRVNKGDGRPELEFLKKVQYDKNFNMSQGWFDCMTWKGVHLFKTVFDVAIYQMLVWELKPKTIIEIGSGAGGSAIWMSDLVTAYNLDCRIISVDITPPAIQCKNVTFIQGDCYEIETVLNDEVLNNLEHPWLVIEDAHVNVPGVLDYMHLHMMRGDYLNIEDSISKQQDISAFLDDKKNSYLVDTLYCDFFGRNLTCSFNSIFRRE